VQLDGLFEYAPKTMRWVRPRAWRWLRTGHQSGRFARRSLSSKSNPKLRVELNCTDNTQSVWRGQSVDGPGSRLAFTFPDMSTLEIDREEGHVV
jgi:hypothetical protein